MKKGRRLRGGTSSPHDAVALLHEAALRRHARPFDRLATGCFREAARRKRKLVERDLLPRVLDRDGLERDG
ncbi:MAG: hypothetical protein QM767_02915 [Anaeromyxobacter sp.]